MELEGPTKLTLPLGVMVAEGVRDWDLGGGIVWEGLTEAPKVVDAVTLEDGAAEGTGELVGEASTGPFVETVGEGVSVGGLEVNEAE